ncbi:DUF5344 family protein [Peribacillus sp. SCS-37]|uniref:DUF5344 family protein n=1 Tax=Paraperibacillus esterisolvens TaxID=3115296 RepID=UPI00390610B5
MSKQIKIDYAEVGKALNALKGSSDLLNSTLKEVEGSNKLDVIEKLVSIREEMHNLVLTYKQVLNHNINATEESIHSMKETDEIISTSIRQ